jgi:nitrite reductase (NO-forming)
MWRAVREWYIVGIGLLLIAGGLALAAHQSSPPAAVNQAAGTAPDQTTPAPKTATRTAQQAAPGTASGIPAPRVTAAAVPAEQSPVSTAPAAVAAPQTAAPSPAPLSHDHAAASAASETSAQAPPTPSASAASGGDPVAGRLVFRKCQVCHSLEPGKNILGPSLGGIIGRKAGAEPGYSYSPALKQADIVWDTKTLDSYLADPQKMVPGNKMPFPGLKTEHDRADVIAFVAAPTGGAQAAAAAPSAARQDEPAPPAAAAEQKPAAADQTRQSPPSSDIGYVADAKYTLRSGIAEGRMVYIGVGGAIEGKVNPLLTAAEGQVVQLTLINGEGAEHDIVFPDQDTKSPRVTGKGASTTIALRTAKSGDFIYFCSVPGHQLAGMQGQFIVTPRPAPQAVVEADISREPDDLPPPTARREPQSVRVDLLSVEVEGRLAEGTTFGYWTFNGKVPGPFIRVRVGDTIDIHLKNSADSAMIHSVDFHAVTGPGGGAAALQVDPGHEKSMTWKALVPGLYVYHCATPMVAEHIANGMYGLILVEPEEGLPRVDHEFYVMQGEIYTDVPYGQHGSAEFSVEKRAARIFRVQRLGRRADEAASAQGQSRRCRAHLLRRRRSELHLVVPRDRRDLRQGLFARRRPVAAARGHSDGDRRARRRRHHRVQDQGAGQLHAGRSRAGQGRARTAGHPARRGPPNPDIYNGQVMSGMGH